MDKKLLIEKVVDAVTVLEVKTGIQFRHLTLDCLNDTERDRYNQLRWHVDQQIKQALPNMDNLDLVVRLLNDMRSTEIKTVATAWYYEDLEEMVLSVEDAMGEELEPKERQEAIETVLRMIERGEDANKAYDYETVYAMVDQVVLEMVGG